jgi:transcriptional regulator with XRE-family HTH domain
MSELGEELKRLRAIKQDSLRDVEEAIEISNAYLSQLERGDAKQPSPHWLYKLANYYKVPYESLMKLAGYIDEEKIAAGAKRPPSTLERLLMAANLEPNEESEVVRFVEYVTSKRKKED